jgi:hypothetical protein
MEDLERTHQEDNNKNKKIFTLEHLVLLIHAATGQANIH